MNIDKEPILHAKEVAETGDQEKEKSSNNKEKRTRPMSSSSSTKSREGERKKPRFGFDEVEVEQTFQSDTEEWSEDEYIPTFKDAPKWARGMMNYLKLSVGSIKESTNRLKSRVRIEVRPMENDSTQLYKNGDISVVITCS